MSIMRRTIYLPDELDDRAAAYVREHGELTFSALVQEALAEHLAPLDPSGILDLAGLVPHASMAARERAEDQHARRER
jgi:hypothetical protein